MHTELIDAQGRVAAVLTSGYFLSGKHQLAWEGRIPAGLYGLKMTTPQGVSVKKVLKAGE